MRTRLLPALLLASMGAMHGGNAHQVTNRNIDYKVPEPFYGEPSAPRAYPKPRRHKQNRRVQMAR